MSERDLPISVSGPVDFSALDIAERVGHEAIDITYRYAHLFPAKRAQIADALSELRGE